MSDSLFISLTLLWITATIWIIGTQNPVFLILHLVILYCVTQVRYTGLFYPLISIAAILFAYRNKYAALALSALPVLVMYFLVQQTKSGTKEHIGVEMFSGFSGWQMANNALHIIPYIDLKVEDIEDQEIRFVHQMVLNTRDSSTYPENDLTVNFIWDKKGPLKGVLFASMQHNHSSYLPTWYRVSEPLGKYGSYLMKTYPVEFARHYLWINLKRLFYPQTEILGRFEYNAPDIAKAWFNIKAEFKPRSLFFHNYIAPVLPATTLVLWILLFGSLVYGLIRKGDVLFDSVQRKIFWILLFFGVTYCAFSIYASPIVLRYITPINAIQVIIAFVLINGLLKPFNEPQGKQG